MLKDGKVHCLSPKEDVTAENILEIYGVEVTITEINKHKVIIPLDGD